MADEQQMDAITKNLCGIQKLMNKMYERAQRFLDRALRAETVSGKLTAQLTLADQINGRLTQRLAKCETIIDKLHRTKDGQPTVRGDMIHIRNPFTQEVHCKSWDGLAGGSNFAIVVVADKTGDPDFLHTAYFTIGECYSSREALLTAENKEADAALAGLADKPADNPPCEFCLGHKDGLPGNENVIGGHTLCDYCAALWYKIKEALDNGKK